MVVKYIVDMHITVELNAYWLLVYMYTAYIPSLLCKCTFHAQSRVFS